MTRSLRRSGPLSLALIVVLAGPVAAAKTIRVGITEYQHLEKTYAQYEALLGDLAAAASGEDVGFSFAVGTHGEVWDWYDRQLIDVAVVSALEPHPPDRGVREAPEDFAAELRPGHATRLRPSLQSGTAYGRRSPGRRRDLRAAADA